MIGIVTSLPRIKRDVVILNTEHQCHPELVSGSQKLRRFRNMSWIIGRSAGSTQPSRGRVSLSLHSCQNPQFGMTINKISPSPHPSPTRGEGIKPPPRNQRFRSSRKGWTLCSAESQGARESFLVLKVCHYE